MRSEGHVDITTIVRGESCRGGGRIISKCEGESDMATLNDLVMPVGNAALRQRIEEDLRRAG